MGLIIAKFRKKKSNADVLDRLDKEIKFIEDFGRDTEQKQRKIVGRFLLLSIGVYVVATFLFCYCFYPADLKSRALSTIPIILTPVVILCLKWLLSWYFSRKLDKNQKKLVRLKDDKKKLLENIMETETYKVARGILEKYAPEQVRKVTISNELTPARPASSPGTEVRNRFPAKPRVSIGASQTPQAPSFLLPKAPAFGNQIVPRVGGAGPITPRTPLPRSILPRDRSVLDKMVEYLVGDGPSNRYALICRQCSGHNGMALKEEFEYISYQCCYCYTFNPARKKRPAAPKLEFEGVPALSAPSDTSESEKNSGSDSDQDVRSEGKRASPEPGAGARTSDTEAVSDFDKLSDIETKTSDTETAENERVEPEEETVVAAATAAEPTVQ